MVCSSSPRTSISKDVIDKYFTGTVSRVGGIGLEDIQADVEALHNAAFDPLGLDINMQLEDGGAHKFRSGKEEHLFNPQTIHLFQKACFTGDYDTFKQFTHTVDNMGRNGVHLRSLLDFNYAPDGGIPLDEVEPVSSIVKRFKAAAMSYGALSSEAHETIAIALNRLGGRSNTGEGGEPEERYHSESNSKIKQVASARFGVTSKYLVSAEEIQIKLAQGAKPGEGGNLPGAKVYPWIAKTRHSTTGVGLISPPPHHDIYSIEDLAELIYDLKNANRHANINVKLVSEAGVGTIAAGVAKGGAQVILVSGYDGGTGAAPRNSIKDAGLPWELGIAETHQTLILNGLRTRVRIESDSKLLSGRDVAISCMLGAEEFGFGTSLLMTIPNMKLDKSVIERRIKIMQAEGVEFRTNMDVGGAVDAAELLKSYDAIVLCCGAKKARDLNVPGRDARGIHLAVDYLTSVTKSLLDSSFADGKAISAAGKNVLVIGGGDTGNDCQGTALRQGCTDLMALEMMPQPPKERAANNPWPEWPRVLKVDYGQTECLAKFGKDPRVYQTTVKEFLKDEAGNLTGAVISYLKPQRDPDTGRTSMVPTGEEFTYDCQLAFIAAGFVGCEDYVAEAFGVERNAQGNVADQSFRTNVDKVFVCGDMRRGQSLVVWGLREGRDCAAEVDRYLMGYTNL